MVNLVKIIMFYMYRTPCFCSMFSELFYFVGRDIEVSENESNVTTLLLLFYISHSQ